MTCPHTDALADSRNHATPTWRTCMLCGVEVQAPPHVALPSHALLIRSPEGYEPPAPVVVPRWEWRPNARTDMQALAWVPGANDPVPTQWLEDETDHERRAERRTRRVLHAQRRLSELCVHGTDGVRFAALLQYRYGMRGEVLDKSESPAAAVAERFVTPEEMAEFARELRRRNRGLGDKAKRLAVLAAGCAILAAAEGAYERNEWEPWVPSTPVHERPESAASAFEKRWTEARGRIVELTRTLRTSAST